MKFEIAALFLASTVTGFISPVGKMFPRQKGLSADLSIEAQKLEMYSLAASIDRGFGAKKSERDAMSRIIGKMSLSTTNLYNPTAGLYPFNDTTPCMLEGTWKMVYTSAFDVLSLAANPATTVQAIYQVIASNGASANIIDLAPRIQSILPFQFVGEGSVLRAKVQTYARAISENRVGLAFIGAQLQPLRAFGLDVSGLPAAGFTFPRPPSLFGVDGENGPGYFDVLYLDKDCLIIRQNEPSSAGVFISSRVDADELR